MSHIESTGRRIKELRIKANLSQKDLAERLSVSKTLISSYENDSRNPSISNLILLADLFNVTTDYLLCRKAMDENKDSVYVSLKDLSAKRIALVQEIIGELSVEYVP